MMRKSLSSRFCEITAIGSVSSSGKRPKAGKLAVNLALRDHVQDRLSGLIARQSKRSFDERGRTWR